MFCVRQRGSDRTGRRLPVAVEPLEPRVFLDSAWSEDYGRAVELHRGRSVAITVDLDNDGDLDSVVWRKKALRVFRNDGDGPHALVQSVGMGRQPLRLAAGDFNGDGFTDIAAIGTEPGGQRVLTLFKNKRNGTIGRVTEVSTPAHTVQFVDFSSGVRDYLLLLRDPDASQPAELSLHRTQQGELVRLRALVTSLEPISPAAMADFDGDGRDDALLVAVNDRGMSALLEVRVDLPHVGGPPNDPARQVFATSEFRLAQPMTRQAGSEDASGPGLAFVATRAVEAGVKYHVMTMELPGAVGMAYGMPTSIFMEVAHDQTPDSFSNTLQLSIVGVSDIDRDGDADVVVACERVDYTPFGPQFSRSVLSFVNTGGTWASESREVQPRRSTWTYWLADIDGDGDDDLVRTRVLGSPPRLGVQLEFAENISVP
jgi:hypothetical protein